jgi:hypothetical protein
MALQILSDLAKWDEVANVPVEGDPDKYDVRPEAYALVVVGSMAIGMGELNEGTVEEWFLRLQALELVYGPLFHRHDPDLNEWVGVTVTRDMLDPYLGTRTNVFPKESATKFASRMGRALMNELAGKARRAAAVKAEADAVARTA